MGFRAMTFMTYNLDVRILEQHYSSSPTQNRVLALLHAHAPHCLCAWVLEQ
jgi:hypothetical protein